MTDAATEAKHPAEGQAAPRPAPEPGSSFYIPLGDGAFESSELTRGPWSPDHQHAGPPAALLGRAIERCDPKPNMVVGRISFDILRPVPIAPLRVDVDVLRPGGRVDLVEARLSTEDGEVMVARAWRLLGAPEDTTLAPPGSAPPGPAEGIETPFFNTTRIGYHTGMEWRFVRGSFVEPGPATAWMRMRVPLVPDEDPSPLVRLLTAADSGNGVSWTLDPARHVFINTDLHVAIHRPLEGEWICLEADTIVTPGGAGLTDTRLHDERGPIGRATQTLLVAAR